MMAIESSGSGLTMQYVAVAVIIAASLAWIVWKVVKARKNGGAGCCGCSLAETCGKSKALKNRTHGRTAAGRHHGDCPTARTSHGCECNDSANNE